MPQVCNLLVHHARNSPGLERFVMDKCADSMHMALQVFWFLQAAVEDAARHTNKETEARCRLLRTRCETAAVNGHRRVMLEAAAATSFSAAAFVAVESPFSGRKRVVSGTTLFPSSSAGQLHLKDPSAEKAKAISEFSIGHAHTGKAIGEGGVNPVREEKDLRVERVANGVCPTIVAKADANEDDIADALSDVLNEVSISLKTPVNAPDTGPLSQSSESKLDASYTDAHDKTLVEPVQAEESATEREISETPLRSSNIDPDDKKREHHIEVSPNVAADAESPGCISPDPDYDPVTLLGMKQERFDYFNDSVSIAKMFVSLSLSTREASQEQRQSHLSTGLEKINKILLRRMKGEPGVPLLDGAPVPLSSEVAMLGLEAVLKSVHLPLTRASAHALRILRVHSEEVVILTSRTRAPYLVNIEVLPTEMLCSDKFLFCEQRVMCRSGEALKTRDRMPGDYHRAISIKVEALRALEEPLLGDTSSGATSVRRLSDMTPAERQRANVRKVVYGDSRSRQPEAFRKAEASSDLSKDVTSVDYKAKHAVILGVYGELWSWKEERILSKSPFKDVKGTRLMPFIVKAGDDLRQEQLAVQLITQLKNIFDEEGVDVFLRPFTVMSISSEAGFVEVIPDSVSVHSLKKRTPNFVSLLDYFERAFGRNGTDSFRAAQRRFIRSMAGYSLVTYLLQIKDRHNGNIMLDAEGRVVHIDFGFMLTNSPGAIKFENVPFKLTEEYLQVICAKKNVLDLSETSKTEGYRYFQELFVLGLLAARKHYEKITMLVEIMTEGTTMPCMTGGQSIVESLRSRFAVGMPEEQCINFAIGLIEESRLSWRSAGYDRFQAYSNGYR